MFGPVYLTEKSGLEILEHILKYYKLRMFAHVIIQPHISYSPVFMMDNLKSKGCKIDICTNGWATKQIDLACSLDEIGTRFSKNHIRSIKKAKNEGIEVLNTRKLGYVEQFYDIYENMNKSRQVLPIARDKECFVQFIISLLDQNNGYFYVAMNLDKKILGGALFIREGIDFVYQFGATDRNVKLPILHSIFNQAIFDAKRMGFLIFDLGGYAIGDNLNAQTANINKFKDGFGGIEVNYPSSYIIKTNVIFNAFVKAVLLIRKKIKTINARY